MHREDRTKGFFVAFGFSSDALTEINRFFKKGGKVIVPLTLPSLLSQKLADQINHKPGVARQVAPARSASNTKIPAPQKISARFSRANLALPRRALRQK